MSIFNHANRFSSMNSLNSRNLCPIALSLGILLAAIPPVAYAQVEDAEEPSPKLRLQYRTEDQAILYVVGQGGAEVPPAEQTCDELEISCGSIPSLDTLPLDCSNLHAIIIGSNAIDFFGGEEQSPRQLQVFATLEKFVAGGGHLLLFGSYNGRNSEHLATFGIHTSYFHNDYFRSVPGRTNVLFAGMEDTVPAPKLVHSMGSFTVDEDRSWVKMLQRGTAAESGKAGAEHDPDGPVLATVAYKRGRVSYCAVEPQAGGLWLVPIAVKWIARGAPTNEDQLDANVVVPKSLLRVKNSSATPAFDAATLQKLEQQIDHEFAADLAGLDTSAEELQFASSVLEKSQSEKNAAKRFLLTKMAWQHELAGGDLRAADEILANAADQYTFHLLDARLELLPAIEKASLTTPPRVTIDVLLKWASEAEVAFHYAEAARFTTLAQRVATSANDPTLIQIANEHLDTLKPLVAAQEAVAGDLKLTPGEQRGPDVKSRLGRFIALSSRDWELGLPLLAKGSNLELRKCAELDLAEPDDPARQIELADLWKNSADGLTPLEHQGAQERARYWYLKALPSLTGVDRTRITASLASLELPRIEIKVQMQVDGSGQLEVSHEGVRWTDFYGNPVSEIHVNSQKWSISDTPVLLNQGTTEFLPGDASLDYPQIRRVSGRGMVVLHRNSAGVILVDINDVPGGSDDYEFVVDVVP